MSARATPLAAAVGERFIYGDIGYFVLAELIERGHAGPCTTVDDLARCASAWQHWPLKGFLGNNGNTKDSGRGFFMVFFREH